jgi:probable F420-dependent oxidoreductase
VSPVQIWPSAPPSRDLIDYASVKARPFRFGVQEHRIGTAAEWRERAHAYESMGYEAFYLPDHFDKQPGPLAALAAAAGATTKLRIGSLVFDNDYRHPVVLHKEAATLDVLSDGRLDLGVGAGWLVKDYERAGMRFDSPGTRIERLDESIQILKGLFAGGKFSFDGKHYSIQEMEGFPPPVQKPHPPFLLGGGGKKMLTLAGREADIVHLNFNLSEGRMNPTMVRTGLAATTDEKVAWIREAAGSRFEDIELGLTIFRASVTDERDAVAAAFAPMMELEPRDILELPHFLVGTVQQIVEDLQSRRERFGVTHIVLPDDGADDLAPVVERLAGT